MNTKKFSELSMREKVLVLGGGTIVILLLYFGAFLMPTLKKTAGLEKKITTQQADWKRLETMVEEHRKIAPAIKMAQPEALLPAIERLNRELSVQGKLTSIQPFGEGGREAEVKMEDLSGPEIVQLMNGFKKAGITVRHLYCKDYDGNGLWFVKIYLKG